MGIVKKLFSGSPLQPVPELEMHRATYEAFRGSGWESPVECLAAYTRLMRLLESEYLALPESVKKVVEQHAVEEMTRINEQLGLYEEGL